MGGCCPGGRRTATRWVIEATDYLNKRPQVLTFYAHVVVRSAGDELELTRLYAARDATNDQEATQRVAPSDQHSLKRAVIIR